MSEGLDNLLRLPEKRIEGLRYSLPEIFQWVQRSRIVSFNEVWLGLKKEEMQITPGKINISFRNDTSKERILGILEMISEIDRNAHHRLCLKDVYRKIEEYKSVGYTLMSYAKVKGDVYRMVFQVPFHKEEALKRFAESLAGKTFNKSVFWEGRDSHISRLVEELRENNWCVNKLVLEVDEEVRIDKLGVSSDEKVLEKLLTEEE